MDLTEKSSRQSLIPNFLYTSSSTKTFALEKMLHSIPSASAGFNTNVEAVISKTNGGFVIPSASEPAKKIEMYSPTFYAACTAEGILSCGLTHTAVTPLDLVKCNMQAAEADMRRYEMSYKRLPPAHKILDLVRTISDLYFQGRLPVTLSHAQASILLCIGLQSRDISYIEGVMKLERQQILALFIKAIKKIYKHLYSIASEEIQSTLPQPKEGVMKLERQQILALFIKAIKKIYKHLYSIASEEIQSTLPQPKEILMEPHKISVDEDLNNAAREVEDQMKSKTEKSLNQQDAIVDGDAFNPELFQEYVIKDGDAEFENALQNGKQIPKDGVVTLKSSRKEKEHGKHSKSDKSGTRRGRAEHGSTSKSKSNKKRKF